VEAHDAHDALDSTQRPFPGRSPQVRAPLRLTVATYTINRERRYISASFVSNLFCRKLGLPVLVGWTKHK
jgi:hypothetical protein